MTLIAYHNDPSIKTAIISELEAHRAADQIVQGQYWANGKGCAVGCTVKSANHAEYEPRFGIPEMLARLEDVIFEGLPNSDAQNWPVEFMAAIEPGALLLPARLDLANHSPDGFEWGYAGSGPAQLALALCADALGDDQRALAVHQTFKLRIVARLPERWVLAADDVRATVAELEARHFHA